MFFMAWTFFYAIFFVIACLFLPFRLRFELARVWARVILALLRWTCRLEHRVEGVEQLPPGNHIVLMKHSSSWETVAQAVLLPTQVWVLKRELTWIPFVGWGIRQLHAIAVNRSGGPAAVRDVIAQGKHRLAEGAWVVIFPEGTRMPPGQTRKYGVSGAMLAEAADRLIVPVAHDSGYYWPRRGLMKRPGIIRVVIGPPISAAGRNPREVNSEAQTWIEAHSGPPDAGAPQSNSK
ncbi:MAG TPA: lysophospholipid acyltransferase family protein [Steroidobacteraceae bacterium]|jgi:1-acyl-sn-glycerol-3-phosphate acyltransferase|nr:lysophospholipid acyltransferase family protein [Steroidobacteraceae bacterium]